MLDAYAVIAYLRDEPAAGEVAALLRSDDVSLTSVGLAEVVDHLVRLAGFDEEEVLLDLAELGLHDSVVIDSRAGGLGGRLRARYYHRTTCAVSMADCLAAVIAHERSVPLATSDSHLLDVCEAESIDVIVLSRSDGTRWTPSTGRRSTRPRGIRG